MIIKDRKNSEEVTFLSYSFSQTSSSHYLVNANCRHQIFPILVGLMLVKCLVNICWLGLIQMRWKGSFKWCSVCELMISLERIRALRVCYCFWSWSQEWQSLFKDVRMLKIGILFIVGQFAKCGFLWFLGHAQLATLDSLIFQKAPGGSVFLTHELKMHNK